MNRPDILAGETLTDRTAMQVRCRRRSPASRLLCPAPPGRRRGPERQLTDAMPGSGIAECGAGAAASTIAD
jgi:hypothetical protein